MNATEHTFDDESTLVQVMAWCHQAASHYLNQCWPRSQTLYGIPRLQWVNSAANVSVLSMWYIYPYSSRLLLWHWGNHKTASLGYNQLTVQPMFQCYQWQTIHVSLPIFFRVATLTPGQSHDNFVSVPIEWPWKMCIKPVHTTSE